MFKEKQTYIIPPSLSVLEIGVFLNKVYFKLENKSSCEQGKYQVLVQLESVENQVQIKRVTVKDIWKFWNNFSFGKESLVSGLKI